jgi:hypothetical protein
LVISVGTVVGSVTATLTLASCVARMAIHTKGDRHQGSGKEQQAKEEQPSSPWNRHAIGSTSCQFQSRVAQRNVLGERGEPDAYRRENASASRHVFRESAHGRNKPVTTSALLH